MEMTETMTGLGMGTSSAYHRAVGFLYMYVGSDLMDQVWRDYGGGPAFGRHVIDGVVSGITSYQLSML